MASHLLFLLIGLLISCCDGTIGGPDYIDDGKIAPSNNDKTSKKKKNPILSLFAESGFDWSSSTTHAPISITSIYAKAVLSGKPPPNPMHKLPESITLKDGGVVSVKLANIREVINEQLLSDILALCNSQNSCNPNESDDFGMTPLHWARYFGSEPIEEVLLSLGAVPSLDAAGRMPANMSYAAFRSNSKKWAKAAGRECQIPEIRLPLDYNCEQSLWALKETHRLMFEGEPLMIRNVLPWLKRFRNQDFIATCVNTAEDYLPQEFASLQSILEMDTPQAFVERYKDMLVTMSTVPYGEKFGVETRKVALDEYYYNTSTYTVNGSPAYVFQSATTPCEEGYDAISHFLKIVDSVQSPDTLNKLICLEQNKTRALEDMHFYMGHKGSGAPLHVHADALNLAVTGLKQWWIVPPREAEFRKDAVKLWRTNVLAEMDEVDKPMTCEQRSGDMVYVPFDWGHAVENLSDEIFGYTLEVVNQRDSFISVKSEKLSC